MLDRFFPPVNPDPEVVLERLASLVHSREAFFRTLRRLNPRSPSVADALEKLDQLQNEWAAQLVRADLMISSGDFPAEFRRDFDRHRNWIEAILAAATTSKSTVSGDRENRKAHLASICFRQLPRHVVTFPVAAIESGSIGSSGQGRINRMTLELFRSDEDTVNRCLVHPLQAGLVYEDDSFAASISHAWQAATAVPNELEKSSFATIATYRSESQSLDHLTGPSAGGALTLGFLRLLHRQPYDPAILVIATIDRNGDFGPVSPRDLPAKVAAAVEDGTIDTIATVPDHVGFMHAELERLGAAHSIRVRSLDEELSEPQGVGV